MKDKDNKENVNDNKSDKITDFSEVVKRSKEIKDNEEIRKKEEQSSLYRNNPMIDLLDQMGIDINDQGIQNLFKELDMEELVNMIQSGNPSMESIYQLMDKLASAEQKFKQEKEMYRTFFQWVAYRKPYDLASLYQIEAIRNLAEFAGVTVEKLDSKNDIIQKIIPNLKSNLVKLLKSIDNSVMLYLGRIIYSDGKFLVEKPLSEIQEMQVDFFQSKCLISRVNDNGNHYLVIPKEIFEIMQEIDFNQISKYNQLNERINRTIIAFANSYGAYPKKLVVESILENEKNLIDFIQEETLEEYIEKIIQFSFSNSVVKPSLYMNIVTSQDYINHGLIEFTKSLIDIQNENISEYKHLSKEEINKKGNIFYYEDSIYLTQLLEILIEENGNIHSQEAEQIKNQIYVFSLLEFEPNLILQILEMRYQMPESTQYHKFLEIFRNYYKNGEKWILKGYTSFEANSKDARQQNQDYDVSKIVRIDFPKND